MKKSVFFRWERYDKGKVCECLPDLGIRLYIYLTGSRWWTMGHRLYNLDTGENEQTRVVHVPCLLGIWGSDRKKVLSSGIDIRPCRQPMQWPFPEPVIRQECSVSIRKELNDKDVWHVLMSRWSWSGGHHAWDIWGGAILFISHGR